jgi:hypothetical protein
MLCSLSIVKFRPTLYNLNHHFNVSVKSFKDAATTGHPKKQPEENIPLTRLLSWAPEPLFLVAFVTRLGSWAPDPVVSSRFVITGVIGI